MPIAPLESEALHAHADDDFDLTVTLLTQVHSLSDLASLYEFVGEAVGLIDPDRRAFEVEHDTVSDAVDLLNLSIDGKRTLARTLVASWGEPRQARAATLLLRFQAVVAASAVAKASAEVEGESS